MSTLRKCDEQNQSARRLERKEGREMDSDRSMLHPRLIACYLETVIGVERQEVKVCLISDSDNY